MDHPISLAQLTQAFDSQKQSYRFMNLDDGYRLVISIESGRIFGPFTDDSSVGLSWICDSLTTPESYAAFCRDREWNMGGDRLWAAPEFPFFTRKRSCFNETYTVQDGIDPGHYALLEDKDGGCWLQARLQARLYESPYPSKHILAEKKLDKSANPLRHHPDFETLMRGVRFCGYDLELYMKDLSPEYPMELEIWDLCQVRPGGSFLIPYTGRQLHYVDYYAPSMGCILTDHGGYATVSVDSVTEHKIGFLSLTTLGRAGYLKQMADDEWCLLIRNYFNDPSCEYIKEPSDQPGRNGCSLFIYTNDTRGDGLAELETTGRTFSGRTGQPDSRLLLNYWYYTGSRKQLLPVIELFLGITLE